MLHQLTCKEPHKKVLEFDDIYTILCVWRESGIQKICVLDITNQGYCMQSKLYTSNKGILINNPNNHIEYIKI